MNQSKLRSNVFFYWLKGYAFVLMTCLLVMSAVRVLWFLVYQKGDELSHYRGDLMRALWLGARFDLSALCHLTILSLLIWLPWLLCGPNRWATKMLRGQRFLWTLLLLLLSLILAADFAFYGYFQDHLNVLVFGLLHDDTSAILRTIWKNYPVLKIGLGAIGLYWLSHRLLLRLWKLPTLETLPSTHYSHLKIVGVFLSVALGARGSLGLFPLEIMHTAISPHSFINTLSFNGPHALIHAIQLYDQQHQPWNENLVQLGYQDHQEQALSDFSGLPLASQTSPLSLLSKTTSKKDFKEKPLPHVVFVLMESWGSDWMAKDSPSFNLLGQFANHKKTDLFTPSMLPSNVATIGSLGSLLVDLPHRFFSPFLTESAFLNVEFSTAPARIFKNQGYQTHFIYGGNPGWRSIDKFIPRQGFDQLHAESHIKEKYSEVTDDELTHDWGVYDEYVFDYALDLLAKADRPQFIFILTTSNHPPYTIPRHYNPLPLDFSETIEKSLIGDLQLDKARFRAFQYANDQLGHFLHQVKEGPLNNKTVVAATGDHSFYIRSYENLEFFEKWAVPFYLRLPKYLEPSPKPELTIASHIDIFPTLYNLLFSEVEYTSFGQDLLDKTKTPWAIHSPSMSAFEGDVGIIVSNKGHLVSTLCKKANIEYIACAKTDLHEKAQKRLLSLMGSADFVYERERKKGSSLE